MSMRATRIDNEYLYYLIYGSGYIDNAWSHIWGSNDYFNDHWQLFVRPTPTNADVGLVDMSNESDPHISLVYTQSYAYNSSGDLVYTTDGGAADLRTADRLTLDHKNVGPEASFKLALQGVEFIDAPVDNIDTHLQIITKNGFETDGTLASLTMHVGHQAMTFTGAARDSTIFMGPGYDTIDFVDHLDVPGEQFWSVIRRQDGELDVYSLFSGYRVQLGGGYKGWTAAHSDLMNYGEIEEISLRDSRNGGTDIYLPGVDLPTGGNRGTATNIDLRSDGQLHSDSFNLAYFNFIRYTTDNVWVGEATVSGAPTTGLYAVVNDQRVTAERYGYDAPVLDGTLSVIGQSRNGTHDLIVREQETAIDGKLQLFAFNTGSGLYNEFNRIYLGSAAGDETPSYAANNTDIPSNRVALFGFGGNDILIGGAGKDYIFGGLSTFNTVSSDGKTITSASGNVVTGGTGADYFGTGATNEDGALINAAGSLILSGLPGFMTGSTSTGGIDGQGTGEFWASFATDVITDWEAGIDTLVVLENGVAIIGGLRDGETVVDLRGANTSTVASHDVIDLRAVVATSATATTDQDFDGARGGSNGQLASDHPDYAATDLERNWDQTKSPTFTHENQQVRDNQSITNESTDRTVVNKGLIVARGLGGNDTILDSTGNDYLYGNRGINTISLAAGGNDRVYYDLFDGGLARHYVTDFSISTATDAPTNADKFYVNKGVIDAFYSAGASRALTTANVDGVYTKAIAYAPSINFLHDTFYSPSFVAPNAVHRNEDGTAPSVLSGSDGTTFGIGVGMVAAGTVLLFVPFMAGVGAALIASGAALGAGSALVNTQPHQNATFHGNVGAYLNVLTETGSEGAGSLLQPETAVGNPDTHVSFLSFFEGVNAGDGYLPVVEFTSHADQAIYGYFALHSTTETFVYLVASRDNLVEASEAILVAQIQGHLTAADFAVYDGRVDIYNQAIEEPIIVVEPDIAALRDSPTSGTPTTIDLTSSTKRFNDVQNALVLTVEVPGDVVGSRFKIYDGTTLIYDATGGIYGSVTLASSTYDSVAELTTFVFSDGRSLGTKAIQIDDNAITADNQFQLADTSVNYTVEFIDSSTGIATRDSTGRVEVAGGNAIIDGDDGDDILFISETSDFLNNAENHQIVGIETISLTGSADINLSKQTEDFLIFGSTEADTITGGSGNDTIVGSGGADSVDGGSGNDTFVYAQIADLFVSGALVDSITGGDGIDTIRIDQDTAFTIASTDSFARADTVQALAVGAANAGDISITLHANAFTQAGLRSVTLAGDTNASGTNIIDARSQTNGSIALSLTGSAGNDIIFGGAGADALTGGTGTNTYVFITNDVAVGETVTFTTGATEIFRVDSSTDFSNLNGGTSALTGLGALNIADGQSATFTAAQVNNLAFSVNGNAATSLIVNGTASGETINLSNLSLSGGLSGFIVNGSGGADVITGTSGNDIIRGGVGNDVLFGGSGQDVFVFEDSASANGVDTLVDFAVGTAGDKLDFRLLGGFSLENGGSWTSNVVNDGQQTNATGLVIQLWSSASNSSVDVNEAAEIAAQFGNALSITSGGEAIVISGEDTSAQEAYIWYVKDANNNGAISVDEVTQIAYFGSLNVSTLTAENFIL